MATPDIPDDLDPRLGRLVAIIDRSVRGALDAADERARERGVCWACGRPLPPDELEGEDESR